MRKLKIEVGGSYRLRNDVKGIVIKMDPTGNNGYRFIVEQKYLPTRFSVSSDGYYIGKGSPHDRDIISKWEDLGDPVVEASQQEMEEQTFSSQDKTESILQEAEKIINGDRAESYGDAKDSFEMIAKGWSLIAKVEITSRQVAHMMIWLKTSRDLNQPKRDNIVDIAGYAGLIEKL